MSLKKPTPDIESTTFICKRCKIKILGYTNLMRHEETLEHRQKAAKYLRAKGFRRFKRIWYFR